MLEFIGYFGALLIGLVMGLLGGGGSILGVPILAYLFHYDEKIATAYSLFIVGLTALLGSLKQLRGGMVDKMSLLAFGIPAVAGVTIIRAVVVPVLPEQLFTIHGFEVTRRMGMFGLFALLMLLAAYSMLTTKKKKPINSEKPEFHWLMISEGLFVGALTGMVGAGGGFLIVPALIVIAKLDIKKATATSLVIIALNSLVGFFLGDFFHIKVEWGFILVFISISIVGIFIGTYLSKYANAMLLKKAFGFFIIIMAIFIFTMEFIVNE